MNYKNCQLICSYFLQKEILAILTHAITMVFAWQKEMITVVIAMEAGLATFVKVKEFPLFKLGTRH